MDDVQAARIFGYRRVHDQDAPAPARRPVVIVGAGPVGLVAAIDLAQRGVPTVLLDDADRIGEGSRAVCFAKRSLEVFDRLGVGERMMSKGVMWKRGRVFLGPDLLFEFDLLPEAGHRRPAFINLQQFYVERYLAEAAAETAGLDMRWGNEVIAVMPQTDRVRIAIGTPEGSYEIDADWLIAADGVRSSVRRHMNLAFDGRVFEDRFLIVDVRMKDDLPKERFFWFAPHFHDGQQALMHPQPDDVWRIDLQLGRDADPERERTSEAVIPRIERMLGHRNFELVWTSVYTYHCRRLERFVHGRVVFAGDAAHQVTPFGARGANSGIQDAENLGWKLALVLRGAADRRLIDSYHVERSAAADENIYHSSNTADFVVPRFAGERRLRDAVLDLARTEPFARRMVNSGRLSVPAVYETPLSTPDGDTWGGSALLGGVIPDAPVVDSDGRASWLFEALGRDFNLVTVAAQRKPCLPPNVTHVDIGSNLRDSDGLFQSRFDASPGAAYLVRPDLHLAARWRSVSDAAVAAALRRARGAAL